MSERLFCTAEPFTLQEPNQSAGGDSAPSWIFNPIFFFKKHFSPNWCLDNHETIERKSHYRKQLILSTRASREQAGWGGCCDAPPAAGEHHLTTLRGGRQLTEERVPAAQTVTHRKWRRERRLYFAPATCHITWKKGFLVALHSFCISWTSSKRLLLVVVVVVLLLSFGRLFRRGSSTQERHAALCDLPSFKMSNLRTESESVMTFQNLVFIC